MKTLRIWVKDGARYRELDNGPFPITDSQLDEARKRFVVELAAAKPLHGANHAPQTTARAILKQVVPALSDFDCLMLGFAVTNAKVRTELAN